MPAAAVPVSALPSDPRPGVPLGVTLAFTAFMAVLVPVYWWNYGPTNFLYFCDISLFVILIGLWVKSPLLISMAAVGIVAPQALWVVDFLIGFAGGHFTGMTDYMFNANSPLFLRGLSLFHGWLPFLLVYLVWRVGYDRRAFICWTVLAWVLILICYTLMPGPRPDAASIATPVNINYVHGMGDTAAQTIMPPLAWVALEMVALPLVLFLPTHFLLAWLFPRRP